MRKRIALFTAAVGIIVAGVVAFMAFESYTLDINAHLEPVLSVNPHGDWDLGTVYPETDVSAKLFVGLSNSAKADPNFNSVAYNLACVSKPDTATDTLSLCPNIEVFRQDTGASAQCAVGETACKLFSRSIVGGDNQHGYAIDILWPDCLGTTQKAEFMPKVVDCGFDPETQKFAGVDLAARISIQVLDIDQNEKCITKKDGTPLATCVTHTPAGANQLKGDAQLSANAQIIEIHFGKSSQPQAINFLNAVVKSCGDDAGSLTGHEKGTDELHGDLVNVDHEVWTLDFGTECIVQGTIVLIGYSETAAGNFTAIKDIVMLNAIGAPVGGLRVHN